MTKVRTDQGTVRVGQDANNNVYAGKDGNVYRKDSTGNWSKYDNGSWNSVDQPQGSGQARGDGGTRNLGSSSSDVTRDLNRDAGARQRGSERASSYSNSSRSGSNSSRGGGGFRGGGGGRRR